MNQASRRSLTNFPARYLRRFRNAGREDRSRRRVFALSGKAVPDTGSFQVRFADGPSKYFHFDDVPGRRLRPDILNSEQVLEQVKAFARAERDKG